MKTRWIQLIAGLTMFVLCISVCTTTANAAEAWSEYFEAGLTEWTIYGYIYDELGEDPVPTEGNFSYASGMLVALDDDVNIARHDSDTSVGTWSFDMFVPDDDDGHGNVYVEFLSNGSSFIEFGNASFVSVGAYFDGNEFVLWSIVGSSYSVYKHITDIPLQGWHHIEVSRSSEGRFLVSFNSTIVANVTRTSVTSSMYLQFICNSATGAAIDNIVVTIPDEPTTPTTPTPIFDPGPIILVGIVAVVVIVLVVVFAKRR
jgi:hypothetical protein